MAKLSAVAIRVALAKVPAWKKRGKTIERVFEFKDFAHAMRFVNRIARLAEKANHHPDIDVRWNRVRLVLSTHDSGGLTERDFALAHRVDQSAS